MNSTAASTPTVPKVRRVTELKNVFVNSLSGSGSMISREAALDARPDRALLHVVAEPAPHQLDGAVDVAVVEVDALDGVLLAAAPVALLEALPRALRDRAELGVVVRERVDERLRAVATSSSRLPVCDGSVVHLHRPGSAAFRLRTAAIRGCGSGRRRTRCT